MSDEHFYDTHTPVIRMRVWALGQMVWGAFIAGAVLTVVGGVLAAVWAFGLLLPEESKQAPSPFSGLEIVQQAYGVV